MLAAAKGMGQQQYQRQRTAATFSIEDAEYFPHAALEEKIHHVGSSFSFDGFQWRVLNAYRFHYGGSRRFPERPKNGMFVVVEFELQNTFDVPRYHGDMVLVGQGTQFRSEPVSWEEELGYQHNWATEFEPGSRLKTYVTFDATLSREFILLVKQERGDGRVKVQIGPPIRPGPRSARRRYP